VVNIENYTNFGPEFAECTPKLAPNTHWNLMPNFSVNFQVNFEKFIVLVKFITLNCRTIYWKNSVCFNFLVEQLNLSLKLIYRFNYFYIDFRDEINLLFVQIFVVKCAKVEINIFFNFLFLKF
jgi:hypothetical protein